MARELKPNIIRGQPRTASTGSERLDRLTHLLLLLRLVPCRHLNVYTAGSLRICEDCDTVWRFTDST